MAERPTTMAKPTHTHPPLPHGHVPLPTVVIGGMGLGLTAVLQLAGLLAALDRYLASLVAADPRSLTATLSPFTLWAITACIAFGMVFVLLNIPGNWRRIVISMSTLAVIAGWLPVAAIANAHAPVAVPLVAAAWVSLCTIIYGAGHEMDADAPAKSIPPETPEPEDPDATD